MSGIIFCWSLWFLLLWWILIIHFPLKVESSLIAFLTQPIWVMFSISMLTSDSWLNALSLPYWFSLLWALVCRLIFLFFRIWRRRLLCWILMLIKTFSLRHDVVWISTRSWNWLSLVVNALWLILVGSQEHILLVNKRIFGSRYLIYLIFYLLQCLSNVKCFGLKLGQILNILSVILVHKLKRITFINGWNFVHVE